MFFFPQKFLQVRKRLVFRRPMAYHASYGNQSKEGAGVTVAAYEKARLSRDARFDGRFFTAVLTTGIYCRPVCPARPPKPRNVRYYPTAASAEEAGFRPCLRCCPEAAPGSPPWAGTSTTVAKALRMIDAGALDEGSVDDLADRLGVTARHLTRLFRKHLGASPVGVAQTRRLKAAKQLLDQTALPLTEVAMAAGYGSLRRFNAAFQSRYRRAPRDLRRETVAENGGSSRRDAGSYEFRLAYRPPYDWEGMLAFLALRAVPGLEQVSDGAYRRTIELGVGSNQQSGWIEVSRPVSRPTKSHAQRHCLRLAVHFPKPAALFRIIERVRGMFDLSAAPGEIAARLRGDGALGDSLRRSPGLRVPGCWDGFELAVRAVLGQQVTVAGARTLVRRLVERYGERIETGHAGLGYLFPTAKRLAAARLNDVGLTKARVRTVKALAAMVSAGELRLDGAADPDTTAERLLAIPGIGDWTVQYIAMRALGNPDAFPAADLGVLQALGHGRKVTVDAARSQAEAWRPWRAYAVMHLWQGHSTEAEKVSRKRKIRKV